MCDHMLEKENGHMSSVHYILYTYISYVAVHNILLHKMEVGEKVCLCMTLATAWPMLF